MSRLKSLAEIARRTVRREYQRNWFANRTPEQREADRERQRNWLANRTPEVVDVRTHNQAVASARFEGVMEERKRVARLPHPFSNVPNAIHSLVER